MTLIETPTPHWKSLIGRTIRERAEVTSRVVALQAAAHSASEVTALAYTEPYLVGMDRTSRIGVRRAVGICAKHPSVVHVPGARLGWSLRALHYATSNFWPGESETRNQVEAQVAALPMMDVEAAVSTLDGLVGRCGEEGVGVNFYALAYALAGWGNGISEASRRNRSGLVVDFYSPMPAGTELTAT